MGFFLSPLLLLLLLLFLLLLLLLLFLLLSAHLQLFRRSCCLVASCEFLVAFAACVVIFSAKIFAFLFFLLMLLPGFINKRALCLERKTPKQKYEGKVHINIRATNNYEPKSPDLL